MLVWWYHRQSGWTKRPQPSMKLDVWFLPNFRHGKQNRKGNLISSVIPFIISPYLHNCLTQMGRFPAWLRIRCYRRWTSSLKTCGVVFLSISHWPWAYDLDLDVDLQGKSSRWTGVGKVCHRTPDTQQIVSSYCWHKMSFASCTPDTQQIVSSYCLHKMSFASRRVRLGCGVTILHGKVFVLCRAPRV